MTGGVCVLGGKCPGGKCLGVCVLWGKCPGGQGVYPHSHGSITIVGIDASKGFVDLWVHIFLAMECIHRNGYRRKLLFWSFD